jgi:hypothetical protein
MTVVDTRPEQPAMAGYRLAGTPLWRSFTTGRGDTPVCGLAAVRAV